MLSKIIQMYCCHCGKKEDLNTREQCQECEKWIKATIDTVQKCNSEWGNYLALFPTGPLHNLEKFIRARSRIHIDELPETDDGYRATIEQLVNMMTVGTEGFDYYSNSKASFYISEYEGYGERDWELILSILGMSELWPQYNSQVPDDDEYHPFLGIKIQLLDRKFSIESRLCIADNEIKQERQLDEDEMRNVLVQFRSNRVELEREGYVLII